MMGMYVYCVRCSLCSHCSAIQTAGTDSLCSQFLLLLFNGFASCRRRLFKCLHENLHFSESTPFHREYEGKRKEVNLIKFQLKNVARSGGKAAATRTARQIDNGVLCTWVNYTYIVQCNLISICLSDIDIGANHVKDYARDNNKNQKPKTKKNMRRYRDEHLLFLRLAFPSPHLAERPTEHWTQYKSHKIDAI